VNAVGNYARKLPSSEKAFFSPASSLVSVAEGYARWAPTYDAAPNPLLACEERHLLPLLGELHDKRILDLACGTGRWLAHLVSQPGFSGVGIDCSAAMLRIAGAKSSLADRLVKGALEILPFSDASFDLALCSFALSHVHDLRPVIHELARVTNTGADVFVSDLHPEGYARGWRVGFRDNSTRVEIETNPRTGEQVVQAFSSAGFECVMQRSLCLGHPEKPLFARSGKLDSFTQACQVPAVLLCHFRRATREARP
jgi:ubiquinone/menaquinone biosynthesis C-methylase UbiE